MVTRWFCTPEWLEDMSRRYQADPHAKEKLKILTATICYRVRSDPEWGIGEDIIFGAIFVEGELRTLDFFSEGEAYQEAQYLMAATPQTWKRILRRKSDFASEFILGKITLELGTQLSVLELAPYINLIFDILTQADLKFPDEMSGTDLSAFRSKMNTLRRERGP